MATRPARDRDHWRSARLIPTSAAPAPLESAHEDELAAPPVPDYDEAGARNALDWADVPGAPADILVGVAERGRFATKLLAETSDPEG